MAYEYQTIHQPNSFDPFKYPKCSVFGSQLSEAHSILVLKYQLISNTRETYMQCERDGCLASIHKFYFPKCILLFCELPKNEYAAKL